MLVNNFAEIISFMNNKNPFKPDEEETFPIAERKELLRANDELQRERVSETLCHLVSRTYVNGVYGFEISEINARVAERTMVGFKLGFLGIWLPEWQFVENEDDNTIDVSSLATTLWDEWGEFDQKYFVEVMATHTVENIPKIGDTSTYGELVQQGIDPLQAPEARHTFRYHGAKLM